MRLGVALLLSMVANTVVGWGEETHKTVSFLSGYYLTSNQAETLQRLMGWEMDPSKIYNQLADVSNWADKQNWSFAYHTGYFVDNIATNTVDLVCGSTKQPGCLWQGIRFWTSVVLNPASSVSEKRDSMKFIIHVMADALQPLHVGRESDWGGSLIKDVYNKYTWANYGGTTKYTLHQVWDKAFFYFDEINRKLQPGIPAVTEESIIASWQRGTNGDWGHAVQFYYSWMQSETSAQFRQCRFRPKAGGFNIQDPMAVEELIKSIARESAVIARDYAYPDHNNRPIRSNKMLERPYMESRTLVMRQQVVRAATELGCFLRDIINVISPTTTTAAPEVTTVPANDTTDEVQPTLTTVESDDTTHEVQPTTDELDVLVDRFENEFLISRSTADIIS